MIIQLFRQVGHFLFGLSQEIMNGTRIAMKKSGHFFRLEKPFNGLGNNRKRLIDINKKSVPQTIVLDGKFRFTSSTESQN